ncbi:MAG: hypothetical protein K9L79_14540 [Methylobacter tundripaludum]|nr:hypothetical protein [Methylobacter tundripaludum]
MPKQKPITQTELDMVARLNSERFSTDDLLEISDAVHDIPEESRDWEGRMFLLAKRFPRQHYRAMAADYRLTAMSALIAKNILPLGVLPQTPDGSHMVGECVFEAAALEPLLLRGNEPFFEPESFRQRVLELTETDGKA